jgi:hypothetical protein
MSPRSKPVITLVCSLLTLFKSICRFFGENIDPSDSEVAKAYCDDFCDVNLFYIGTWVSF